MRHNLYALHHDTKLSQENPKKERNRDDILQFVCSFVESLYYVETVKLQITKKTIIENKDLNIRKTACGEPISYSNVTAMDYVYMLSLYH